MYQLLESLYLLVEIVIFRWGITYEKFVDCTIESQKIEVF